MRDLEEALSEISHIRHDMARMTQFRGYGPRSIAFSGMLALGIAWAQTLWGATLEHSLKLNLSVWIGTAAVSIVVSGVETFVRARRVHDGMAHEMIHAAVEQFLPALIVGVLLTSVLVRVAPDDFWLLPGLWELVFSLGIFASCRFLPRRMFGVAVWYLCAGLCSLIVDAGPKTFLPWSMGAPFGIGQLLVAGVLHFCGEDVLEET